MTLAFEDLEVKAYFFSQFKFFFGEIGSEQKIFLNFFVAFI